MHLILLSHTNFHTAKRCILNRFAIRVLNETKLSYDFYILSSVTVITDFVRLGRTSGIVNVPKNVEAADNACCLIEAMTA